MTRYRAFYLLTIVLVMTGVITFEAGAGSVFFVVMSLAACLLFYRNDRSERPFRLPDWLANALSFGAFALTILLVYGGSGSSREALEFRVPVVGRYLMFVQWILFFKAHTNRDLAWVYFITLTHVVGAALLMPELPFAAFYAVYVVLAVATLTVYQAKVETELAGRDFFAHRARVRWRLLPKSAAAALALMLPAAFFFALLPRGEPGALSRLTRRSVQPITGFAESVRLGDLGRILKNPERVMQVKLVDEEGRTLRRESLRMRGVALDTYDGRRWRSSGREQRVLGPTEAVQFQYPSRQREEFIARSPAIRCEVTLEPLDTRTLFAPFSLTMIRMPEGQGVSVESMNEVVRTTRQRRRTLEYYVESRLVSESKGRIQRMSIPRGPARNPNPVYLQLPNSITPRVRELAREIARADENPTAYEMAGRIDRYLSDPANFRYTLDPRPSRAAEPIDDFLFRMHEGHCEYFASAMVVLLRCVGVEARLVNGFAGGKWNAYSESLVYRQRDAHSWVEANIPTVGWFPFDPSPVAREGAAPRAEGWLARSRDLLDFLDRAWIDYVVAFDHDKQSAFYSFLRKPGDFAHRLMTYAIWRLAGSQALMRDDLAEYVGEQVSRYRWVVHAAGAAVLAWVAWIVWRRVRKWRLRLNFARSQPTARFYMELLRLLKRRGFAKPDRLTPAEFADSVRDAVGEAARPATDITWAYYEARYGGRQFAAEEIERLRLALRRLDRDLDAWRREQRRLERARSA